MKVTQLCLILRPHGLYSPWNSPGQNTGAGSLSLIQGIFPTQGSNPGLPHCKWILYQLSHKGWLVPTLYVWGWGNSSWSQELLFFLSIHGFTYLFNSLLVCTYYVSITVLGTGVPMATGKQTWHHGTCNLLREKSSKNNSKSITGASVKLQLWWVQ